MTTLPSLTAITGDPALAKMLVPLAAAVLLACAELIVTAALDPLTRVLAFWTTALSAYLAAAATGK